MIRFLFATLAAFALPAFVGLVFAQEPGQVVFDFESGDLQGWQIVQGSFFKPVGDREFYVNRPQLRYNKQGKHYLATVEHPNGHTTGETTGVIESPVFMLTGGNISLMVGGGSHANTYIALCTENGEEVLHARGKNTEVFQPVAWDARPLIGKTVFLKAVDLHPGHWGYIALDGFRAEGRIDKEATEARFIRRERQRLEEADLELARAFESQSRPLREAIEDLIATFGDRYPGGPEFLVRLDGLLRRAAGAPPVSAAALHAELESLRREALIANPLVGERRILFVVRPQYINEHGTEATMYQPGEINTHCFRGGGAVKVLDLGAATNALGVGLPTPPNASATAPSNVTTLLELPEGLARDPEVHFDAKRLVFSMRRNAADCYHLYEMNVDGTGLKQLTFAERASDIQPFYLPDDRIVFSSTREPKYIPCQRHLMANLFVADADGSNIRQLGHNTQFEGHASLMPDGRILYTRWEYVDKHYSSAYGLWTMNPDGSNPALYYGNYAWQPGAIVDGRIVPNSQRFVAIFTSVHDLPWGAMVIADPRDGLDGVDPIVRAWPLVEPYMRVWNRLDRVGGEFDAFMRVPVKYEDPYPLSEKHVLCSRWIPRQKRMGLFLVDAFGNELLLHAEGPGCFDPRPIGPSRRPPVLPSRTDLREHVGTFYVADVYTGEFMRQVPCGTVKYLRVVEAPPKTTFPPRGIGDWTPPSNPDGHHPVAVNWGHYNNKRILGTVPVEPDGSAHFRVPAGRFVYFQLLDADGMMVHSMRSGTNVQPGETVGCVGCHDHRLAAPAWDAASPPAALRHPPRDLQPWFGPAREFGFTAEVQPVLDEHCAECHDYGTEGGKAILLCADRGPAFNVAYTALRSRSPPVWKPAHARGEKPLVSSIDAGPVRVVGPYSWGSHRSRLVDLLRDGHHDVRLDPESFARIVTWIDLNTPYYPTHATYFQTNTYGRCPLDHKQLEELGRLVAAGPNGASFGWNGVTSYGGKRLSQLIMQFGSPINFTRPERSLVLEAFADPNDPNYAAALAIVRQGARTLAEHPRPDMPGFVPCESDALRLDFHAQRCAAERANRAALARGERVEDRP